MNTLNIVKTDQPDCQQVWQSLRKKLSLEGELLDNPQRLEQVRAIIDKVRRNGDAAVSELTAQYDKVNLTPEQFRIPTDTLRQAHEKLPDDILLPLRQAIDNVRRYQQAIMLQAPPALVENNVKLQVRYRPLQRVGVCVPGASAPLVSTVIMTVVPAQVAGVEEIAVVSSPRTDCDNSIHPAVLGLCYELNVTDVYRVSGAQAVAALALGTDNIKKVDKIVGPGSWWGQLAKREVFGLVDIDSFAGPSEVLIIADDSAQPAWIAADMLSQAEHAPGSALLITTSEKLAQDVADQLDSQLQQLDRSDQTRKCVQEYCLIIVTRDMNEATDLANEFAAEHLQIQCRNCDTVAEQITNAGAIFLGPYTPVATGDYFAGPSHTLPTGGSARFFSVLNVNDFLKQTSIIGYDRNSLRDSAEAIEKIAHTEGLDAHARSVRIRLQ